MYLGACLEHIARRQVDVLLDKVDNARVEDPEKLGRNGVKLVLHLEKRGDGLDGDKALVPERVAALGVEDARREDRREVGKVHLGACFLVDVRERGNPLEEDEENLHRVSVVPREEADDEVEVPLPLGLAREELRVAEEPVKPEREERVRHVAEELLEERRQLDWVLVREVDGRGILVKRVHDVLETPDVAILAEDALNRHV